MDNDGYEESMEVSRPSKQGEPQSFDDVDKSISANVHKGKHHSDSDPPEYNSSDAEAAKKKLGDGQEKDEKSVPSCWFMFIVCFLGFGVFAALGLGLSLGRPDPILVPHQFMQGAVSSDHKLCSEVGRDIMINGGNAIDAVISTTFCVSVVNLHVGGIGGGGFLTVYNKSDVAVTVIDAQVVAPSYATSNMFEDNLDLAVKGGKAIAVPGELAGLYKAHQKLGGALKWATLLEPSIRLAKGGFQVTESLAEAIEANKDDILADEYLKNILATGDTLKKRGDTVRMPNLAATLKAIAKDGADAFYTGSLAKSIVDDVTEAGGNITLADLENYSALVKKPVSVEVGGRQLYGSGGIKVYAPPPPSCGIMINYILNILQDYNFSWRSGDADNLVQTYHRMLEAFKFAFAKRSELGDPTFVDSVDKVVESMTSTAGDIRSKIKDTAQEFTYYESQYAPQIDNVGGATHVSVVDTRGNAVSYTSSININFGAKKRGNRTGIIFNAGMGDFSLPSSQQVGDLNPSPMNYIEAGKRPLSSMSPLVLVDSDSEVKAVIGASGGSEMITSSAMMAVQILWLEDNVINAIDRSRIHTELIPQNGKASYKHERDLADDVVAGLANKKQVADASAPSLTSSVNIIMQTKKNRWYTNSDKRVPGSGYAIL